MNKRHRVEHIGRIMFAGCRVCGTTETTLYKDGTRYICRACKESVSELDTKEGEKQNDINGKDSAE